MQRLWTDKLARLSAGVALLVLVVAEEKVCPHLLQPPVEPEAQGEAGPSAASPSARATGEGEPQPARAMLMPVLPDVVPARWSVRLDASVRWEATGAWNGTNARGPERVQRPDASGSAFSGAWWQAFAGRPELRVNSPAQNVSGVRDPALSTRIQRTGPPWA